MLRVKVREIAWKGPGRGRTSWIELREVHDEGTNHEVSKMDKQETTCSGAEIWRT